MFEDPTIEDFADRLGMSCGKAVEAFGIEVAGITGQFAKRGLLNSGPRIRAVLTALEEAHDKLISAVLADLRSAIEGTDLDKRALRDIAVDAVERALPKLVEVGKVERLKQVGAARHIDETIERLNERRRMAVL